MTLIAICLPFPSYRGWTFCAPQQRTYLMQGSRKHQTMKRSRLSQACTHYARQKTLTAERAELRGHLSFKLQEKKRTANTRKTFKSLVCSGWQCICDNDLCCWSSWKSHSKNLKSAYYITAGSMLLLLGNKTRSLGEGVSKELIYKRDLFMF